MTPQSEWFAFLYVLWGALLLVTGILQKERVSRLACFIGAVGFVVLGGNLFVTSSVLHLAIRVVALAALGYAGVLSFRVRYRRDD